MLSATITQNKPSVYRTDGQKVVTPGLPNSWRESLLQQQRIHVQRGGVRHVSRGDAALLLDALLAAGVALDGAIMSTPAIIAAVERFGIAPGLIRRALNDPVFTLMARRRDGVGRPVKTYKLPTRTDLALQLGAPGEISDVLEPGDLQTLTTYKQALYREHIRRACAKRDGAAASFSRKLLAGRLGVCAKTTRNYDRAVGVMVEQRITEQPLTRADVRHLPVSRSRYSTDRRQWLQVRDYYGTPVKRLPAVRALAERELAMFPGCQLELCEQITSSYWLPVEIKAAAQPRRRRWNKASLDWMLRQE